MTDPTLELMPDTVEALTGAALRDGDVVRSCSGCHAVYYLDSVTTLPGSRCVACHRALERRHRIVRIVAPAPPPPDPLAAAVAVLERAERGELRPGAAWVRALMLGMSPRDRRIRRVRPAVRQRARTAGPACPRPEVDATPVAPAGPLPVEAVRPAAPPTDEERAREELRVAVELDSVERMALAWMAIRAHMTRAMRRQELIECRGAIARWGRELQFGSVTQPMPKEGA